MYGRPCAIAERETAAWVPLVLASAAVLLSPAPAFAVQVGCFVTAMLLGFMFLVSLVITFVLKALLSRHIGRLSVTPWKRMTALTAIELFLFILVFALTRTGFAVTLLVYLPFAVLVNGMALKRAFASAPAPVTAAKRMTFLSLLSLALPGAIQVSGLLWSFVTNLITFTELKV